MGHAPGSYRRRRASLYGNRTLIIQHVSRARGRLNESALQQPPRSVGNRRTHSVEGPKGGVYMCVLYYIYMTPT